VAAGRVPAFLFACHEVLPPIARLDSRQEQALPACLLKAIGGKRAGRESGQEQAGSSQGSRQGAVRGHFATSFDEVLDGGP
jgi:hypothetical protein